MKTLLAARCSLGQLHSKGYAVASTFPIKLLGGQKVPEAGIDVGRSRRTATVSTTPVSSRTFTTQVGDVWRQTTSRLLDTPIGSLDPKAWSDAHNTILFWLDSDDGEGIRFAVQLLDRLCMEEEADPKQENVLGFFDTQLLNLVLNHWRRLVVEDSAARQLEELQPQFLANKLYEYHSISTKLKPDTQSFAMLIDGSASFVDNRNSPNSGVVVADQVLKWTVERSASEPSIRPNVVTFSSLMNAWVKSGSADAPERVEKLLDEMQQLHADHPDWGVAPNQVTYATAIDAWAKAGRVDRAEQLLKDMHAEYQEGAVGLKPNLPAFNGYLVALARAGDIDRAESLLEQMEDLYESGELDERPNVISYSTMLDAFAKSKEEGAAEKAEAMLRQMMNREIAPNAVSWNTVIDAYVKSRNVDRAEGLFREMHDKFMQGNPELRPTMRTYSLILAGWSRARSPDSGERSEQLLDLMKTLAKSGEIEELDSVAYNSVLDCWAKSPSRGAATNAKEFLGRMKQDGIEPDTYSLNIVVSVLAREGRIEEAEAMLDSMAADGVGADVTTYNTLLDAWIKSGAKEAAARVKSLYTRMKEDSRIQPDLFTHNTVLHFYAKTGNAEAAETLLNSMCDGASTVSPDSISFNTVVAAWTHSGTPDAPHKAEAILDRMLQHGRSVHPNTITFNSLLSAWVKSRSPEAHTRCQRLFERMSDMAASGRPMVKPDVITFNTLIHAYGLAGDDESRKHSESLFQEMLQRYKSGEKRLKPTVHTYGALVNTWSRSSSPSAGQKAEEYLRMWIAKAEAGELKGWPRVYEFTAVVRAFANSGDPQAVYKADEMLYLLLQQHEKGREKAEPDSKLFGAILALLASSDVPNKPMYAAKLVSLMKEFKIRPDSYKLKQLKKCHS